MKVYIIGEDDRSNYLRNIYNQDCVSYDESDYIICPIPFSRNNIKINNSNMSIDELLNLPNINGKTIITGGIKEEVREKLIKSNIKIIDVLKSESFAIKNAIATSEGIVKKIIEMTPFTINSSNVLVLGYGRIGKILCHNLSSFGVNIYAEARSTKDIALIKSMGYNEVELDKLNEILPYMDIIVNTIPYKVINKDRVWLLKSNVNVIDVASISGVDFEALKERNISTCWYLQIPSKDSPLSSAKYIKETIDEIVRGN